MVNDMEYTWKIKFYMKSGAVICGTYETEHKNSEDAFKEILKPFDTENLGRYTLSVKSGKNSSTNILMNEVEAIELSY